MELTTEGGKIKCEGVSIIPNSPPKGEKLNPREKNLTQRHISEMRPYDSNADESNNM